MARKNDCSLIWLAWARMARRLYSRYGVTSTAAVITDSGMPNVSSSMSGVSISASPACPANRSRLRRTWSRLIVLWNTRRVQAHPVHLDVVRMAVPAVLVVAGQHVSAFLVEERGELLRGLVHRRGPERARRPVGRGAHHARVEVPQELHPLRAEDLRGLMRLGDPPLPQLLARVEEALGDLALLAAGGHDQHDPVPLIAGLADNSAAGDAFVVWVGMK